MAKNESVYLSDGAAYYDGNDPAAQYATYRLNQTLRYLRAETEEEKQKIALEVAEDELRRPRTHARIVGLGSL